MAAATDLNPYQGPPVGDTAFAKVTNNIARIAETPKPPRVWYVAISISSVLMLAFFASIGWVVWDGIGAWGNMIPVAWGWPIVNFVFWVGIGHAGTLISAILFLFRQDWRTAINRFAEAMTIFAVVCAGIFPGIHIGRPWLPYWMFPIPNQMQMWPQFRSPLEWDVFAVSTYFSVSLMFWYMGMIPDLATLRDRAVKPLRRFLYGLGAMGWRGSSRQWHRYERAYLLLAALATPLVLSVHSVVSFDMAVSQLPGWHTTVFPPYFVAGAIYGGFAMVVVLAVPARQFFGLKHLITKRHIENMAKIMLVTGSLVGYSYLMEFWTAWYSHDHFESFTFYNRAFGTYSWACWTMISCNAFVPQMFWFKKVRRSLPMVFIGGVAANIGMWFERFIIIDTSLSRDFLPTSWGYFLPTPIDYLTLAGSFGLFFTLFLLFCRYLPMVAMAEVKGVHPSAHVHTHEERS